MNSLEYRQKDKNFAIKSVLQKIPEERRRLKLAETQNLRENGDLYAAISDSPNKNALFDIVKEAQKERWAKERLLESEKFTQKKNCHSKM
jgi:hypothetical protein